MPLPVDRNDVHIDRIHIKANTYRGASMAVLWQSSVVNGGRIVELVRTASPGTLVFVCLTGGASSLLTLPVDGLSLKV